jgi:tRNA modification GTPase
MGFKDEEVGTFYRPEVPRKKAGDELPFILLCSASPVGDQGTTPIRQLPVRRASPPVPMTLSFTPFDMVYTKDTIVGIATPRGYGGVTIVKISGDQSLRVLSSVFRRAPHHLDPPEIETRRQVLHGYIIHPSTLETVDEVLVSIMPGPKSYTTEDVVEINVHGGPVVSDAVLELIVQQGVRPAEPGEFTQRAFLNGRIDLTQAEAVIDLIHAKSLRGITSVNRIALGGLGKRLRPLIDLLKDYLADIEASIEFEDDIGCIDRLGTYPYRVTEEWLPPLKRIVDSFHYGRRIREGLKVTILGAPNVGKSTLMNALMQCDKAIVTEMPGTTRDLIEGTFFIQGEPTIVTDTAGVHDTKDPIEIIGIRKAIESSEKADLVLWVIDARRPATTLHPDIGYALDPQKTLLVLNKIDLPGTVDIARTIDDRFEVVAISAKVGTGLPILNQRIFHRMLAGSSEDNGDDDLSPNLRQKLLIDNAITAIRRTIDTGQGPWGVECLAEDLKEAIGSLQNVLGEGVSTDVMDEIFNRFCIGK